MTYLSSPPGIVAAPARAYRATYKRSLLDGIVLYEMDRGMRLTCRVYRSNENN